MTTNGHWNYNTEIDPVNYAGFIYKITEIDTGKLYIGKKNFWSRTKKSYRESNWKSYTSSSKDLNEQIKIKGKSNYKFDIISLHYNLSYLNYREVEEMVFADVLRSILPNGEKLFYNKSIGNIRFVNNDIMSDATRKKMSEAQKGKILSAETRAKLSAKRKGKILSDDHRAKIATSMKGENNPNYGKTPSAATREKIGVAKKGIQQPTVICPHCNKSGGIQAMKRYHFDNCKLKDQ